MSLVDQRSEWKSRSHFLAIAAQTMPSIVVDNARAERSGKRGVGALMVPLDDPLPISANQPVDLVLNHALTQLAKVDPQSRPNRELQFFGRPLKHEESALGVSAATQQLQWAGARVWLYHELSPRRED
jgi:hypothetical protein